MRRFLDDESGAVTVDWVVLTAAVVGLGVGVTAVVREAVENVSAGIAQDMANRLGSPYSPGGGGTSGGGTSGGGDGGSSGGGGDAPLLDVDVDLTID